MLDRYWYGKTSRISPEAPVPVVHVQSRKECPGGAGNVALNLTNLGSKVKLYGLIGCDEAGQTLAELLQKQQVDACLLSQKDLPTTTKLRLVSAQQQIVRIDFEECRVDAASNALMLACQQAMPLADLLILSDYSKGCLNNPQQLILAAQAAGLPVLVDPKQVDVSVYRGASVLTPNFKEFTAVVGECLDEAMILEKAGNLLAKYSIAALLVTRGKDGMTLIERNGSHFSVSARAPEVFDVTGAGDTVVAVLAAALAAGETLADAVRLANIGAGIVVGRLGAASVTPSELRCAISKQHETGMDVADVGIVNLATLANVVRDCYCYGESLALIVGEFDILRLQHLELLQTVRNKFDRIVIGVIDQDLTTQPLLHSLEARVAAIAGFAGVDWVLGITLDLWPRVLQETDVKQVYYTSVCVDLMQPELDIDQQIFDPSGQVCEVASVA